MVTGILGGGTTQVISFGKDLVCHMGVSKNRGGPPKWMVYNEKPYIKWMIWGYHYFGNTHIELGFCYARYYVTGPVLAVHRLPRIVSSGAQSRKKNQWIQGINWIETAKLY